LHALIGLVLLVAQAQGGSDRVLSAAIEIARRDHPRIDEQAVRAAVDRLAKRYRALLPKARDPADAFRQLLFEDEPFTAVGELDSAENLHIDSVLRNRKGYCLSLSVVALAVAERVGAPLHGVALPNHFLVRYDDGKTRRNLELTRKGETITDATLLEKYGPLEKGTVYLRNLRPEEVKAYLLHNRGYVALLKKRHALARADFEAALGILPGIGEAHRNLGVVFGEQKKWQEAKRAFIRAINIHASDTNAMINLAICRHALGERDIALQDLAVVLLLDPENVRAEELQTRWTSGPTKKPRTAPLEALQEAPAGLKPGLHPVPRSRATGSARAGMATSRRRGPRCTRSLLSPTTGCGSCSGARRSSRTGSPSAPATSTARRSCT